MDGHDTSEKLIDSDSPPSTFQNQNDEGDRLKKSNFHSDLDEPPNNFGNLSNSLSTMEFNTTAGRDRIVTEMMKDHEDQYTELKSVKIFVGTWNINLKSASENLGEYWLACDISPPDIYAIGFQELDLCKEPFLFTDSPKENEWLQACLMGLHQQSQYELVKLVRLDGMMLIVFIKKELMPYVSQVCEEKVGTGTFGRIGIKGGVAVRFNLYNSSLCFVNSHLSPHVHECERRNQDYNEINSRLSFSQMKSPFFIKDHDQVFWLGDLNYRLMDLNTDQVKNLLYANAINNLLEHDQLKIQQKLNKVFQDYKEGEIKFLPTYKYDPGTDQWDSSEKNRPPAWCDRILWRGGPIKQITYRSHNKLMISDHKPVSSLFESSIKVIDRVKYDKVYQDTMKLLDK